MRRHGKRSDGPLNHQLFVGISGLSTPLCPGESRLIGTLIVGMPPTLIRGGPVRPPRGQVVARERLPRRLIVPDGGEVPHRMGGPYQQHEAWINDACISTRTPAMLNDREAGGLLQHEEALNQSRIA